MELSVRRARPEDSARIDFSPDGTDEHWLAEFLAAADRGDAVMLVAEDAGRAVGRGGLERHSRTDAYVRAVEVAPDRRREGIGTRLMLALADEADALGWLVRLTVGKGNFAAIRLYEALGYRRIGQARTKSLIAPDGHVQYPPEDVWVMQRAEDVVASGS